VPERSLWIGVTMAEHGCDHVHAFALVHSSGEPNARLTWLVIA
jgi:hypothetical protein